MSTPSKERAESLVIAPASPMSHVRSFSPDRSLCGAPRDPSRPVRWGTPDCVVCLELALAMSESELAALINFWKERA